MSSIRTYLIATIIATITLSLFIASVYGYQKSHLEIQYLLDTKLSDRSMLLMGHTCNETKIPMILSSKDNEVFQILKNGTVIKKSIKAPLFPIQTKQGYNDINFNGFRWRTFTWKTNNGIKIISAEKIEERNRITEYIVLQSLYPIFGALPLIGFLIWIIINNGLSPINKLTKDLYSRSADDLRPVSVKKQPIELLQLVNSINNLIRRLGFAIQKEKKFAADAAHELRTPISALKIHLHNIRYLISDDTEELINLQQSIERMAQVVEQILSLYKTSPDVFSSTFNKVNLNQIIKSAFNKISHQFESKNIKVTFDCVDVYINGDYKSLELLVSNLLDNACKYTPNKGRVSVKIINGADESIIIIEDNGPGIPKEEQDQIFDRFYRVGGDQHDTNIEGCGLGLAIVQHIAQLHGASINICESSYETGVAFVVKFNQIKP